LAGRRARLCAGRRGPLPRTVDVLVVGAGYTGLHAALQIARGGRETLVVDAEQAGWGCSTRNGGQISTSIKPSLEVLTKRYGPEAGLAILKEGTASQQWIGQFIGREEIDCDFQVAGRFFAAHTPRHYEILARDVAAPPPPGLASDAYMVPRAEQHGELGSDLYHGGAVYPHHASLHPAKYHRGLLDRVLAAGARVAPHCPVTAIERQGGGFLVQTAKGPVQGRQGDCSPPTAIPDR
jgi:glycine/D-amino acid oxidase-like deaminating enzyme